MIVIDASAVVELLIRGPLAVSLHQAVWGTGDRVIAPHLLDVEVLSALRSLAAAQRIDTYLSGNMLAQLETLPVQRHPHTLLLPRIWELRHNFTAYDAAYVALAEVTGAILYTCDAKLTTGHRARVKVFRNR
jgi:predicted nucleic acid-binding protein